VGGYCFGGAVGFEIARLVESREGKAPHLVVIDGMFPNLVRYRLKYLIGFLQRETPASLCRRFLKKIAVFYNRLKRFVKRERTNMKSEAEDTLELSILPGQLQDMAKENYRALRDYTPKKYQGSMTLITTSSIYSEIDPFTGWDRIVKGEIQTNRIDAGHGSIMEEPKIMEVGKSISVHLRKING
jgi:thioesterase domain-containing protein